MKCAYFVANVWAAVEQSPVEQHPTEENSWQLVDSCYKPIWFERQQLPRSLINLFQTMRTSMRYKKQMTC